MHQHMKERQPGGQGIGRIGAVEIVELKLGHDRFAGGVGDLDGGAARGAQQHRKRAEDFPRRHVIKHRRRLPVSAVTEHHQLTAQQKKQR